MTNPASEPIQSPLVPTIGEDGRVHITFAISQYDHVADIISGSVRPEGVALNVLVLPIEEVFYRFIRYREWAVSEMSFGKYVSLVSQGDTSLTAIPVFPSRVHRHSAIYVRSDNGLTDPKELEGKRVGIPEWAQTAGIYLRGVLAQEYRVDLAKVKWVQAGVNMPGRIEKVDLDLPAGVVIERRPETTLNAMLLAGEIDACLTAHPPECFKSGDARVQRMFPNYKQIEQAFQEKTGIFPIMHVIAIRRDVLDRFPWLARTLFSALEKAKDNSLRRLREATASRAPLPWIQAYAESFGPDPWPYGIEPNLTTLEAFLRFSHEQGVCHRRVAVGELFPPQLQSAFKI